MSDKIFEKPKVKLSGKDGNVFYLIALCSAALKKNNLHDEAKEMSNRCFSASSYEEALSIMMEYCEVS